MWPFESTSHMALLLQFPKTFSIHSRKQGSPRLQMRKLKCRRKRLLHMLQAGGNFLEQSSPGDSLLFQGPASTLRVQKKCLYTSVWLYVCTCVDVSMCIHRSSYVRVHPHLVMLCAYIPNFVYTCVVCVPVFKIWTPTPLSPCPMLTSTKAVSLSYR